MKSILELNEKKVPVVRIDKKLNRYDNVVLFPDKVKKAKEMLQTIGLPGQKKTDNKNRVVNNSTKI